jgi:hypothetical protein
MKNKSFVARYIIPLPFIFVALLFFGCDNKKVDTPDVSNIKLDLQTARFDKDLYAIDTNNIGAGLQQLHAKYPDFLDYFLDTLMAYNIHGNYNDTVAGIREGLKPFLSFKDFVELQDTINKYYPDTKETDEELTNGFKLVKHYFSDKPVPKIIYVNMGLSKWPSFALDNNTFCIGLDMFLGPQYPFYHAIGIPEYMFTHVRKSYIPVSLFSTFYKAYYPFEPDDKTLLDLMVQRGKEQYFLHKVLPYTADSVLFGFTQAQLDWCSQNEALVYNFFIQQNLLYNKEAHSVMPFINDGPFAKGLETTTTPVKVTPGNIGTWLGYRIVATYMAQNPKVSLAELINTKHDPAKLLNEARYKPK